MDFTNYKPALEYYPEDDVDMDDRMDVEDLAFQYGEISKLVDIDTVPICEQMEEAVETISQSTVTDHYLSFLKAVMNEMDKYKHIKGRYLVMNNAPIHKANEISKCIDSQGYHPSYSPKTNLIEQFWSVVKSNGFLEIKLLISRMH